MIKAKKICDFDWIAPNFELHSTEMKLYTRDALLKENGLLVESESRSSDLFKFRVGQHLFEGKVLKVKKMAKEWQS